MRNVDQGLYNLYVVDPSGKQILAYSPAFDGSGFPNDPTGWLAAPQDVSTVDTMLIDGDIYLSRDGTITPLRPGRQDGLDPRRPRRRPAPARAGIHVDRHGDATRASASVYGYDRANSRVLKIDKDSGAIQAQYRLANGDPGWADLRGMAVVAGTGTEPDTLIWIDKDRVMSSLLEAVGGARRLAGREPVADRDRRRRPPSRRRSRPRRPSRDPGGLVIPLRDANPTARRSVVTGGIIVACFVVFALELAIQAVGGADALDTFFQHLRGGPGRPGRRTRVGPDPRPRRC